MLMAGCATEMSVLSGDHSCKFDLKSRQVSKLSSDRRRSCTSVDASGRGKHFDICLMSIYFLSKVIGKKTYGDLMTS